MKEVEFTGTSIEEALKKASDSLQLTSDNIKFEVVSLGSKGFLGVGKKPAAIKVFLKHEKKGSFSADDKRSKKTKRERMKQNDRPAQKDRMAQKDKPAANDRPAPKREKRRGAKEPRREQQNNTPEVVLSEAVHAEGTIKLGEFVSYVVSKLDEDATVNAEIKENKIVITIKTDNTGKIIGKGGRVINSIEYLAVKFARKIFEDRVRVVVQVDGARKAR